MTQGGATPKAKTEQLQLQATLHIITAKYTTIFKQTTASSQASRETAIYEENHCLGSNLNLGG